MQRFETTSVIDHKTTIGCTVTGCRGLGHSSRSSSGRHDTESISTSNVNGLISEINDVVAARGAGPAGTTGVGATNSFGPIWLSEEVASMLVSVPVGVVGERYPPGRVISLEFDAVFRRTSSVWCVASNVPPAMK